jgi:N-acetylneuraminic acid mutarotase
VTDTDGRPLRPAPSRSQRRRASSRVRRRRAIVAVVGVVALVVVLFVAFAGGSSSPKAKTAAPAATAAKQLRGIPAVEAGVLPWALDQPLSREVVFPGTGSAVIVAGGLDSAGTSLARIYSLDTATGAITAVGNLPSPVHDAAGAQLGAHDVVFGGGSPTTTAVVQSFAAAGSAAPVPLSGQLPQPRSDASAVVIGDTAYVVGGYDGTNPDPEVLATRDGTHFAVVAHLPMPVRYAAVVASGGHIYLFGGEAVGGHASGQAVDTIQMVDPSSRTARVVGHLAQATAGAVACVIGGNVYVAGGTAAGSGAQESAGSASAPVASGSVFAFDTKSDKVLSAGTLPVPVAYGAVQVVGQRAWLVGGENNGAPTSSVEMFTPNRAFGTAGVVGAGSPYFGSKLLIADRGNNRLLLLDDTGRIIWTYPSDYAAAPPGGFYFPDDAFFAKHGTEIISNQEQNETIVIIAFPSGQLLWQYGHPGVPSAAPGYLHEPDDAYLLKNGQVAIADADNCRIQLINPDHSVNWQIGTNGVCEHNPPNAVGSPNGDTPLANGDILVSEIHGEWVSEYTPKGALVWTVHLPVGYPSDPQQIGPDLYLISDYSHPGAILEFNREGQVLYKYAPSIGLGELNQPSLTELLPSGVFMTNDDYRNRMVAVDPATQALVWQYGVPDSPGTAPGMLNTPDGFDLLLPDGTTPTHTATG